MTIEKIKKSLNKFSLNQEMLSRLFICILMFTSIILALIESTGLAAIVSNLLISFGLQLIFLTIFKKPGTAFLLLLPKSILDAFQFVLIILWGGSIIAVDMFLNVATTNPGEAGELLVNLWPAILLILSIYTPAILLSIRSIKNDRPLKARFRKESIITGVTATVIGIFFIFIAKQKPEGFEVKNDLYPANVVYNLDFAIKKVKKITSYEKTMSGFSFNSYRDTSLINPGKNGNKREIYILILGETSRAANWGLYAYKTNTTPKLDTLKNLIKYRDAFTQSNTTHKIVPLVITPAEASSYDIIYRCKSIVNAFSQAGFKTIYFTNHEYNQTLMNYYLKEEDIAVSARSYYKENIDDHKMLPLIKKEIEQNVTENLFIIIHIYGSHFKYSQRYSKEFSVFEPENVETISKKNRSLLVNSFDNSILSTDDFIYKVVSYARSDNSPATVLYLSDHGEDLMDDSREYFLHASPIPTYYQLHIPYIIWNSDKYREIYPDKFHNLLKNKNMPISSNSVFHTMLDAASIKTKYLIPSLSLCSNKFVKKARVYLDDHDSEIRVDKLNLSRQDLKQIKEKGLELH